MAALLYQDVDLLDDVEEDDLMKWRGGRGRDINTYVSKYVYKNNVKIVNGNGKCT